MKRTATSLAALAGLITLAACETVGAADTAPAPEAAPAERSSADEALAAQGLAPAVSVIPQSGLQAQTLASNECGLFLWSKTQPDRLIFFQRAASGQARMIIANETVDAAQTANRGTIFGQFMTEQAFLTPTGQQVLVTFQPGEELQGGQRIEDGRLTITAEEGWRTVIPVLGVSACKP